MDLSTRHEIDLIVDCGGDPTGTVDAAAAFNKAYAILSALAANNSGTFPEVQQTLVLRIPPGYFRLATVPTLWDFTSGNKGTSVQIIGSGDSSIIGHDGGGGIAIAANRITITDIAHWGTNLGIVANTGTCLNLNAETQFTIERVHVFNVYAAIACIYVTGYGGTIRDVEVNQCCVLTPGQGCIYSNGVTLLKLDNVICHDVGQLNGQAGQAKTSFGNQCWIRHDDSNDISQGGRNQLIELIGCATSAGGYNGVIIHGGAGAARSIGFVRIVGFRSEPSSLGNTGAVIDIANVDRFEAHGITDGGVAPGEGGNAVPAIKLVGVGHADIRGIQVQYDTANPPDALSNFITADSTCGIVEVYDAKSSPLGPTVVLESSAMRTVSTSENSSGVVRCGATGNDDTGNGSTDAPFATMTGALAAIAQATAILGAPVSTIIATEPGGYESGVSFPGFVTTSGLQPVFFETDVTGTPIETATFPMPNGPFNGAMSITGRLKVAGAGGGVAGDIACQQYLTVVKTVGGASTLYAAVLTLGSVDASIVGTTFTAGVSGGNLTLVIDTTLAATGAGGIIDWCVSIDGRVV